MFEFHEMDWATASPAERNEPTRKLYALMRGLCGTDSDKLRELVIEITGEAVSDHPEWYKNFSRGNYSWKKAHKIHEWLAKNHFKMAQKKYPELFQVPRKSDWDEFLENATFSDGLKVVLPNRTDGFGIASREAPDELVGEVLRISEAYYFKLTSDHAGSVVAFEEHAGVWHPLALGADERRLRVDIGVGENMLPRDGTGSAIKLYEHHHAGPHRFIFVAGPVADLPVDQASITKLAKTKRVTVYEAWIRVIA